MEFLRYVYRIHGVFGFIIAIAGMVNLVFFLMPSHPVSDWHTWVGLVGFWLACIWFRTGYEVYKDELRTDIARDNLMAFMRNAGYECYEITGKEV